MHLRQSFLAGWWVCELYADIEKKWMERWSGNMEPNSDLHLPAENEFIGG